ncbi:MAG: hypothetical protein ABI743_03565, partial [bacterium]
GVDAFSRMESNGGAFVYCSDRDRFQEATNPFYWDFELYTKDLKGGKITRLTKTYNDREMAPSISDDGKRVVYMLDRFARTNMSLYWLDTDKPSERHLLFNNMDKKTFATIAPDGKYVYFNQEDAPGSGSYDIYRIALDTLVEENLTNTKGISELHADVSGDGKTICYERHFRVPDAGSEKLGADDPNHPNQLFEIYTLDVASRKVTRITHNEIGDGFASISADGQWIVFQSARKNLDKEPGKDFELFAIKADGKSTEWQISSKKQSHDFVNVGF